MKKLRLILISLITVLMLSACGTSGTKSFLSSHSWRNIYSNNLMRFGEDGSFELGGYKGTWTLKGGKVLVSYQTGGSQTQEREIIVDEKEGCVKLPAVATDAEGKSETMYDVPYYPEEKVDEARKAAAFEPGNSILVGEMAFDLKEASLSSDSSGVKVTIDAHLMRVTDIDAFVQFYVLQDGKAGMGVPADRDKTNDFAFRSTYEVSGMDSADPAAPFYLTVYLYSMKDDKPYLRPVMFYIK